MLCYFALTISSRTASHIGDVHSRSYCDVDGLQVIRMNVERFSIPELLFHPADIGIQEMGVAEAVVHTISQTPPGLLTGWKWFSWLCLRCNGHLPGEPGLADVILELRMMVVTTGAIRRGQRQSWKTLRWAWGKQVHGICCRTYLERLPPHVTSAPSLSVFRSRLKTHLFRRCFPWLQLLFFVVPVKWLVIIGHVNRSFYLLTYLLTIFHSVLQHCWLGDRKSIRPLKKLDVGLLVVMIWLELCTTYSSSCTTTSIILCSNKHRLTHVHLENGHENRERDTGLYSLPGLLTFWYVGELSKDCRKVTAGWSNELFQAVLSLNIFRCGLANGSITGRHCGIVVMNTLNFGPVYFLSYISRTYLA